MKRRYQALIALACLLSACADHWRGGGRRQQLPSDDRMQEGASGGQTDGGASSAGSPSDGGADGGADASVGGTAGVGGLGFNESAGTAGIPGLP